MCVNETWDESLFGMNLIGISILNECGLSIMTMKTAYQANGIVVIITIAFCLAVAFLRSSQIGDRVFLFTILMIPFIIAFAVFCIRHMRIPSAKLPMRHMCIAMLLLGFQWCCWFPLYSLTAGAPLAGFLGVFSFAVILSIAGSFWMASA